MFEEDAYLAGSLGWWVLVGEKGEGGKGGKRGDGRVPIRRAMCP